MFAGTDYVVDNTLPTHSRTRLEQGIWEVAVRV